jgi:hypothetical protein
MPLSTINFTNQIVELHQEAKRLTEAIKANEAALISTLVRIDELKVFRSYGYPSLYKYLTLSLGFSEHKAYSLILVTRAVERVPKLGRALSLGEITVSKARRIAPVIDNENVADWVNKSRLNSHRQLEKVVANESPEMAMEPESYRYISQNQVEVKIVLKAEEFLALKIICPGPSG